MKVSLALVLLACAPALMAQEPESLSPVQPPVFKDPIPAQEDLAEHAALVQQLGAAAAKGFDTEAHARALRQQIEAVMAKGATAPATPPLSSAPVKAPAATESPTPASPATDAPTHSRDLALRQAIQKLRAVLADLEGQLGAEADQH